MGLIRKIAHGLQKLEGLLDAPLNNPLTPDTGDPWHPAAPAEKKPSRRVWPWTRDEYTIISEGFDDGTSGDTKYTGPPPKEEQTPAATEGEGAEAGEPDSGGGLFGWLFGPRKENPPLDLEALGLWVDGDEVHSKDYHHKIGTENATRMIADAQERADRDQSGGGPGRPPLPPGLWYEGGEVHSTGYHHEIGTENARLMIERAEEQRQKKRGRELD